MKVSFKQKIKNLIAIFTIILSIILIKINSNIDLAYVQERNNDNSIIKIKSGSNVFENTEKGLNLIKSIESHLLKSNETISLVTKDTEAPNNIKDIDYKTYNHKCTYKFQR